jgi:hypothetical protein
VNTIALNGMDIARYLNGVPGGIMMSLATCLAVAFGLAIYAHWKGRTGWHWFLFAICAFAAVWFITLVTLDFAGVYASPGSRKLAIFAGALSGTIVLLILISVPQRARRHVPAAQRASLR